MQPILFAPQIELLDLKLARFQTQIRSETVDLRFEDRQRVGARRNMPADFSVTGVHRAINRNSSGKLVRFGSEKTDKRAEVIDRA